MTVHARLDLESALATHRMTGAREFALLARGLALRGSRPHEVAEAAAGLGALSQTFARKAAAIGLDAAWGDEGGRDLARAFLATIADGSLIDRIMQAAVRIPWDQRRVLIAAGAVADTVSEGLPKLTTRPGLDADAMVSKKCAAIVAMTAELIGASGSEGIALVERELRHAVLSASNRALLSAIPVGQTLASTGDAVGDLNLALDALGETVAVVVAARPGIVRQLAVASDGRMGLAGGEFVPGLAVVPVRQDTSTPAMTAIAADRCAISDLGLIVRGASHASLEMGAAGQPAELVSLFQCNSRAVLVEREFRVAAADAAVAVG